MPGLVLFNLPANVLFFSSLSVTGKRFVVCFFSQFVLPAGCLINDEINMMCCLGSVLSIEVTVKTSEFGRISKGLFVLTKGRSELSLKRQLSVINSSQLALSSTSIV